MAETPNASQTIGAPSDRLVMLIFVGFVLQIVGGGVAGLNWPGTDLETGEEVGSIGLALLGLGVAALGGMVALVGVIGFGVLLGMRVRDKDLARAAGA